MRKCALEETYYYTNEELLYTLVVPVCDIHPFP